MIFSIGIQPYQLISTESSIALHQPESISILKWRLVKFPSSSSFRSRKKSPGLRFQVDISMKPSLPQVVATDQRDRAADKDRCCRTADFFLVVKTRNKRNFFAEKIKTCCKTGVCFWDCSCILFLKLMLHNDVLFLKEIFWSFICSYWHFKQPRNQNKKTFIQQIEQKSKKSQLIQFGFISGQVISTIFTHQSLSTWDSQTMINWEEPKSKWNSADG